MNFGSARKVLGGKYDKIASYSLSLSGVANLFHGNVCSRVFSYGKLLTSIAAVAVPARPVAAGGAAGRVVGLW
jgi:hypothetical protein